MKIYKKGTGEKYTPFSHFDMTTEVIFNPDLGCKKANITLSTLKKGAGSFDEVHEHSDQIFYVLKGQMKVYAGGKLLHTVSQGDAIMVEAGEVHAVINEDDEECVYYAVTVPPLDKTH
ncbi:MAG: Cupin domain protein [Firmicutes bacterium ADurb.Bin182]|nr:MAG: Cupin domain protein [Firmicutes bacterium ADurb.Bin182]